MAGYGGGYSYYTGYCYAGLRVRVRGTTFPAADETKNLNAIPTAQNIVSQVVCI